MKKLVLLFTILLPALARAQGKANFPFDPMRTITEASMVLVFYIFSAFVISLIRLRMNDRFRDKLIESERSEEMIDRLLRPAERYRRDEAFRTMAILGGITMGLALASAAGPISIWSVAIMTFCLTLSFLGYFFYLGRKNKD
jgi:hypothetical protein